MEHDDYFLAPANNVLYQFILSLQNEQKMNISLNSFQFRCDISKVDKFYNEFLKISWLFLIMLRYRKQISRTNDGCCAIPFFPFKTRSEWLFYSISTKSYFDISMFQYFIRVHDIR